MAPFPVIVTTRIVSCLVGDSYKPSFATITGKGDNPRYLLILKEKTTNITYYLGGFWKTPINSENEKNLRSLTACPWKMVVGRRSFLSYWVSVTFEGRTVKLPGVYTMNPEKSPWEILKIPWKILKIPWKIQKIPWKIQKIPWKIQKIPWENPHPSKFLWSLDQG